MKTSTKGKLAAVAAIGLAAFGASRWLRCGATADADPAQIAGRVWVDSRPVKYTDYVHELFVSRYSQIAVFEKASAYTVTYERADYRREGKKLALSFPQTGKAAEVTFAVTQCSTLPPFDLCLDLSDNPWGGPRRFYGMTEQEDESKALGKAARRVRDEADEPSPGE